MAKVSILIPVYNTERYIAEAIESILAQTYKDFELVIADDCSSDNTYTICQQFADSDKRIRLYRNDKNLGMMPNWNHGISLCTGDYWGKLDADDAWEPTMIEKCVDLLDQYPEVGMVCSRHINMDEQSEVIEDSVSTPPEFCLDQAFSFIPFVKEHGINMLQYDVARQGIGLIRRQFFEEHGDYLTIQPADTELYFRIGAHYMVYCINEILHYHRVWEASDTRSTILNEVGRKEYNLFVVRKSIIVNYQINGFIDRKLAKDILHENACVYLRSRIHKHRLLREYLELIQVALRLSILCPTMVIKELFRRIRMGFA